MHCSRIATVWLTALSLIVMTGNATAQTQGEWEALDRVMEEGADKAAYWTHSWLGIYGMSATTSAVLASRSGSSTERYNSRVRTVTSSLAFIDVLLNPLPHRAGYVRFESLRDHNDDEALALSDARRLAREIARTEQNRRAWSERLGSVIVNTTAGLVIGIGDDRPEDGITTALVGMAVTEAKIRTQPQTLSQASSTLQIGETQVRVYPQFAAAPGHVMFNLRF